ncbi:MAG: hypothetical protein HGA31_02510 [Candidatus Moranbacteria bacterium]|nr:hypothetical protein [Candidatus Moranbacteria bacterium]
MKIPSLSITKAFGSDEVPYLLHGGQEETYRSGDIVLKPVADESETNWSGETFGQPVELDNVRIPNAIRSVRGNWSEDGYCAWSFLEGSVREGRYAEKVKAADSFHALTESFPRPDFIAKRKNVWSVADKMTWGEIPWDVDGELSAFVEPLRAKLAPIDLPDQVIHGDLSGNFLLHDTLPPAIIDITMYFRPAAFAKAVILTDSVWDREPFMERAVFDDVPHLQQLAIRATLWRILSQSEQLKDGKDRERATLVAKTYADNFAVLFPDA